MYKIRNTTMDRTRTHLHRVAAKLVMEPVLGGHRIKMRETIEITDDHYAQVKDMLAEWESKGMVEVTKVGVSIPSNPMIMSINTAGIERLELNLADDVVVEGKVEVVTNPTEVVQNPVSEDNTPKKGPGRPKKS